MSVSTAAVVHFIDLICHNNTSRQRKIEVTFSVIETKVLLVKAFNFQRVFSYLGSKPLYN